MPWREHSSTRLTGRCRAGAVGLTGEDHLTVGAFRHTRRCLAVADRRGRPTFWDARGRSRAPMSRAVGCAADRVALAFSADGALHAAGAPDGSVQVRETPPPAAPTCQGYNKNLTEPKKRRK
ncbi:hypothetical protein PYK79_55860, partial [Streptomyces sp. ID05-04B]|nr:hypothetical protein [Streptomyces sp. ID05-04B]